MKKITLLSFAAALFFLTSCEVTREISITENGSGKVVTTYDMSQMLGIMKMSGQGGDMQNQKALDSTISFATFADSIPNLSPDEKELLKKGSMGMVMNMEEEKMQMKTDFSFNKVSDLPKIQKLSGTLLEQAMKKEMESKGAQGMPDNGLPTSSFDEYFITTYNPGVIEMKLDKEKYAKVSDNKELQQLKEALDQGMPFISRTVINLPKSAKKVEGANAKLSDDKMKVTIENDMSGFFDDATKLEFRIEY